MAETANTPAHILVVDDEPGMRVVLRRGLEAEDFSVSEACNLSQAMGRLNQQPPISLITLDLILGSQDGLLLARQIRSTHNVPIIMITARTSPVDRVTGLEHGADDYIIKPFHIREVVMRIRNVLQRYDVVGRNRAANPSERAGEERYEFEAGIFNVRRRELIAPNGVAIDLTDAEIDLLLLFLRNPGRVLSRDDLMLMLKGHNWSPTDRTIDGHIARLRKKIEADIETPRLIKSVWRVGYVFAGDVNRKV
jgi:two-component system, OmpR family, response regulator